MTLILGHGKEEMDWMAYSAEKERVVEYLELGVPNIPELPIFLELFFDHHCGSVHAGASMINIHTPERAAMKLLTLLLKKSTDTPFFLAHHIAAYSAQVRLFASPPYHQ